MKEIIKRISYKEAVAFLIDKHYSGRKPQVKYAYGLFVGDVLNAVITYGEPASHSLCIGVMGKDFSKNVIELNRMCRLESYKGFLSHFISYTLKDLKQYNLLVVSYSDTGMHHNGYVYQACNFLFTGTTKQRTDKYTVGNKHSRHYTNDFDYLRKVRTAKNRYIYFACDKAHKRIYKSNLKYSVLPYPKKENRKYKLGAFQKPVIYNKITKEYYTEN